MNYFDIIIVIPLIWGAYKGFTKGFIIEIASLIALALGVWGGVKFSSVLVEYLSQVFEISPKLMPLISFAVTFIIIVLAVFAIAKFLQKIIKLVALSFINKLAGLIFGCLKFTLIISIIINLVNIVNEQIHFIDDETQESSILYKPVSKVAQILIPGIKDLSIDTGEVTETLINS